MLIVFMCICVRGNIQKIKIEKVDYFEYMLFITGLKGLGMGCLGCGVRNERTDYTESCSNTSVTKEKQNNCVHCLYRIKALHEASWSPEGIWLESSFINLRYALITVTTGLCLYSLCTLKQVNCNHLDRSGKGFVTRDPGTLYHFNGNVSSDLRRPFFSVFPATMETRVLKMLIVPVMGS